MQDFGIYIIGDEVDYRFTQKWIPVFTGMTDVGDMDLMTYVRDMDFR